MSATQRRVVGGRGKRRDAETLPVVTNWQIDVITDRDPDYRYQFFRPDEIADKQRATRVQVNDYDNETSEVHDIPGWEVCHRENGKESLPGSRPDAGKPIDTVLTQGNMVCMRLRKDHWDVLQRVQENRADQYEQRLRLGAAKEFDINGEETRAHERVAPGNIRQFEKPLTRA